MKKKESLLAVVLIPLLLIACSDAEPSSRPTQRIPPPPPAETAAPPTSSRTETPFSPEETGPTAETPAFDPPPPAEAAPPGPLVFAAIGDYGLASVYVQAVADLVKSWDPAFIITLGDNNYPEGKAETIDRNIGQFYSDFIYPYKGEYGPGAAENRFFPTLGNHDWDAPGIDAYLDYFELPGNERYYEFVWGPVHFFALSADSREPDGVSRVSVQAQWLQEKLAASTSPWQIVYMHQPPFSSGHHGSTDWMQWPFAEWGADAVLAGHDHSYERLIIDEIPYIVNGLGGYINRYFFFRHLDGSQFQYRSNYGALRITAEETRLSFEMITVDNEIIDTHVIEKPAAAEPQSVFTLPDAAAYEWQPVATGYRKPLLITHAGDGSGRLFIVEQTGAVRILGQETAFMYLSDRITNQGFEQGLLGLAFDPDYVSNGYFYVNYTDRSGNTVISRFSVNPADPGQADPDSESILLRVAQPFANHNGGHLAFGPDGLLYAGLGDGGSGGDPEGNAQNPGTYLGKLLRIDTGSGATEIFALGLRNPWRFSFDETNGDLYIADVGQNQWEEINVLPAGSPAGANFGWDFYEGLHAFEGAPPEGTTFIEPVFEYNHSQGCSVTGGHVYRGVELPGFFGVYFFSDFCGGAVWGLVRDAAGVWTSGALFSLRESVTSFGTDEAGELYLVTQEGGIYKLVHR